MKTLDELLTELDNEISEAKEEGSKDIEATSADIQMLKDMLEALIDLGSITGMWNNRAVKIAVKNVVTTAGPKSEKDVIARQNTLKSLLIKDMRARRTKQAKPDKL